MEKFKQALIQFADSNPNLFPNDADNSYPVLIEQCFPQFFPHFQTPNHPPYAAMIYKAIWELKKKGGSSEESISKYIKKEYADLPWAHSTLLKHHLQKLCDRSEICMTDKQRYVLAAADSESRKKSSRLSKKRKKQKSWLDSQARKKSGRPHKKSKKNEKSQLGIQGTSDKEQIGLHKRKRKQGLKSKRKSSKRAKKHAINEDIKLQLLGESNLKQNNGVTDADTHEQDQIVVVNMGDIQTREQDEPSQELDQDNSSYTEKSNGLVQPEESPDFNPILLGNGKRLWTRLQLKTVAKKDALAGSLEPTDSLGFANVSKDKPDMVEHWSEEKQQAMEVIKVKSSVDTEPQQISRSRNLDKPLIEYLKPLSSKLVARVPDDEPTTDPSSTVQDPLGLHQDQQTEKLSVEDRPKYKRRGRNRKPIEPEKGEVLCNSKPAVVSRKSQKSAKKGKVGIGNKKGQPKYKHHTMTRRSNRNRRCRLKETKS